MAKLAIKGHATLGKEVIETLEMLGGINKFNLDGAETSRYYYIEDSKIHLSLSICPYDYTIYTLEEFLEKFPYKVGDKVQYKGATSCGSIFEVEEMRWEENTVKYTLCLFGCNYKHSTLPAEYLQPYEEENYCQVIGIGNDTSSNGINTSVSLINEETMEEKEPEPKAPILSNRYDYAEGKCGYVIPNGYEFDSIKQGFQTEIILRPIKLQYPNTYKECFNICFGKKHHIIQVVGLDDLGDNKELFESFIKLKICRDAYWKIAGEEMGLGKPWEPTTETVYCISRNDNVIKCSYRGGKSNILEFPTPEMRDAFYENFKELIENCKELL